MEALALQDPVVCFRLLKERGCQIAACEHECLLMSDVCRPSLFIVFHVVAVMYYQARAFGDYSGYCTA